MEAVFKKRPLSGAAQEKAKDKPQQHNMGKGPDDKHWLEQLAGAIPDDKKEQDKWYKLLMHPLVLIGGVIALAYWWVSQKQKQYDSMKQENEQLKTEMRQLKKKYKKLKKNMRSNTQHNGKSIGTAVLD
jgi:hypothetical protein